MRRNLEDSRIKRRLNQDKYEKGFLKNWIAHGFSQNMFTKEFLLSGNRLPYCCNRLPVAKWVWKSIQTEFTTFQIFSKDFNRLQCFGNRLPNKCNRLHKAFEWKDVTLHI